MRGTISLGEFPKPSPTGIYLYIGDDKTFDAVMRKLEDLGWLWVGVDDRKPTEWHPFSVGAMYPFDVCLGHVDSCGNSSSRLTWAESGASEKDSLMVSGIAKVVANLKAENTRPDRMDCASCGGRLVNPMPWLPGLKHCPKCEP